MRFPYLPPFYQMRPAYIVITCVSAFSVIAFALAWVWYGFAIDLISLLVMPAAWCIVFNDFFALGFKYWWIPFKGYPVTVEFTGINRNAIIDENFEDGDLYITNYGIQKCVAVFKTRENALLCKLLM